MRRYLLNVSYLGTPFRGVQRQVGVTESSRPDDFETVQGQIEYALKKLRSINEPATVLSSRTDAGVHALHNAMHVDLERNGDTPHNPTTISLCLNQYFNRNQIPIRILSTYLVPDSFHSRHNAISRTYLYRLIVIKDDTPPLTKHLPVEEYGRSLFISSSEFDFEKLKEASQLFVGHHDFRTFMHKSNKLPDLITRKVMEKCEVYETRPFWSVPHAWPYCVNGNQEDYIGYNIVLKGNGFLYKQVRRTVASLIAVAKGIVTAKDIKFMLEIPSHQSWNPKIKTVPAHGLYLCEVAYSKEDRDTFKEQLED
ncbi:hypothetical protein RI129_006697 [Pyrocoelia pectoralis]|uniref:tRNA pseudouridine synthase n=1 Tax=Pyrocoelia pectoralis TaxID=417401 RepID=A0AAN7ZJW1_9COLE